MKNRKKPIIISALSLVLCLSLVLGIMLCFPVQANAVELVTGVSNMSSGSGVLQSADNQYVFGDGAKVHVVGWHGDWDQYNKPWEMALDAWWNDSVYTYDATAGKWRADNNMRWQNGDGLEHHFVAWWPENIIKSNEDLTAVDVTVTGDYNKDDILLARWSDTRPENNQLNMEFEHLLSRFDVHLIFRDEYAGAENISIQTHLKKTAECNFLTGEVTATSGEGIKMQKRPYPDANYDWSGTCITVPHNFPMSEQLLTIRFTVNGQEKAISYTHSQDLNFISGERITLNLYVGKGDDIEEGGVTTVTTEQELRDAIAKGGNIKLGDDISLAEPLRVESDISIDLNEKTLSCETDTVMDIYKGFTVSISNGKIVGDSTAISNYGTLSIDSCTVTDDLKSLTNKGGTTVVKNSTLNGWIDVYGGTVTFYDDVILGAGTDHPSFIGLACGDVGASIVCHFDPSGYLYEAYNRQNVTNNNDGTWTVTKAE